jgi:hypothetical protein
MILVAIHKSGLHDVLSNYHELRTKFNLVLDFDNAVAGFTLLRLYDVREWSKKLIDLNEGGTCLSNKTWKRFMIRDNDVINGPCFSDRLGLQNSSLNNVIY